jgi:hypothetical protein
MLYLIEYLVKTAPVSVASVAGSNVLTKGEVEPPHGPFLVPVLDAIVYPDLPEWLVVGCAVLVCGAILRIYLRRYLRRTVSGEW